MSENQASTSLTYGLGQDSRDSNSFQTAQKIPILVVSFIMAVLYSLCFTGTGVYPMFSFFVFCCTAIVALYVTLDRINELKNRKAFRWAVPIVILSSMNGIFQLGVFSYANVIMIHILFAVMAYSAIRGEEVRISEIAGWLDIVRICCGNMVASLNLLFSLVKGRRSKGFQVLARILAGILISLPVLAVIMLFLLDADAVFQSVVMRMVGSTAVNVFTVAGHVVCIAIVSLYLTGYCYNLKHMKEQKIAVPENKLDTITGATFLGLINLLFLFFCVVQMAFLFTGGYMKLPEGIVYSAYAREGFFQLLFVTVINFGVMIVLMKLFPACVKQKPVRILLMMLCIFTGILIVSSFYRMSLYSSVYGYTSIRMAVFTFLIMEMVCVLITAAYLIKPVRDFMKGYLYTGLVFYILVNVSASPYVVSRLNVNRFYKGADLDISQFAGNPDTVSLLMEVADSEFFLEKADDGAMEQTHAIITNYQNQSDVPWQNRSLLQSLHKWRN